MEPSYLVNLHWFYLGIHHRVKLYAPERVHYFLHGPDLMHPEIQYLPVVAESFCLAPHGSVVDYRPEKDGITPVCREGIETQLTNWGREHIFQGIQDFLASLPIEGQALPEDTVGLADAARKLLTEFCTKPSREDAKAWGEIPFEHDQAAVTALPLAPIARLSWTNLKNALVYGSVDRACTEELMGAWGAGSWAARPKPLRLLQAFALLGFLRVHWRHIPSKGKKRLRRMLSQMRLV